MNKTYVTAAVLATLLWGCAGDTNYVPEDVATGAVTTDTLNDNFNKGFNEQPEVICEVTERNTTATEVRNVPFVLTDEKASELGYTRNRCQFSADTYEAKKFYEPSDWDDAEERLDFRCFDDIVVPSQFTNSHASSCAGNHTARLEVVLDDYSTVVTCVYKGQGQTSHCTGPNDTSPSRNRYTFVSCDDGSEPGDVLRASRFMGRVDNGASKGGFRHTKAVFSIVGDSE